MTTFHATTPKTTEQLFTEKDLPSLWNILEHCQAVLQVASRLDAEAYRKILALACDRILEIHLNG